MIPSNPEATGIDRELWLTHLPNRPDADEPDRTLDYLFLDVNDFKGINNVHGHAMGDRVLCVIARRLERCVRDTDLVARMGGDEFTVLISDIQSPDAVAGKVARTGGLGHRAGAGVLFYPGGQFGCGLVCQIGRASCRERV